MALLNQYQDSIFALSLRRLFSSYSGPLVRVIRESDLVEVDILPDSNGEVSYDSFVSRPIGTDATTLGEFLNIDGYTDVDSLGEVYEGRLIKIYDQSVGANHVFYLSYSTAFLFVEHSLPAQFPNSTNIINVNNIPSFFAQNTAESFTLEPLLEKELSIHFLAGQVAQSQNPLGFRVLGTDSDGFLTTPAYDILLTGSLSTVGFSPINLTDVFDVNNVYLNSEQCVETQNNVFEKPSGLIDDTTIATIEFKFLSSAESYGNFADSVDTPKFYIISNGFYTDLIAYEGYDNIRRLFIEDLYATAANNVETKAFTSTLAFTDDGIVDNSFIAQFGTPAAAYSVRSLRGLTGLNGPKVLRVRREVDNAEVDVYTDPTGWVSLDSPVVIVPAITGQIDGGTGVEIDSLASTLGEFVADGDHDDVDSLGSPTTAKVVVWYDQSSADYTIISEEIDARGAPVRIRVVGGTYDAYEFDLYFDDNESISLSSYVADTYEISDGATQVTANLTLGTLQTLVDAGMTDATVCVWYDQSGNANDATQTTTGNQPKIYDSATGVVTENGKPALYFDGSNNYYQLLYSQGTLSSFLYTAVFAPANTTTLQSIVDFRDANDDGSRILLTNTGGVFVSTDTADATTTYTTGQQLFTGVYDGANLTAYVDGVGGTSVSGVDTNATTNGRIGSDSTLLQFRPTGNMQEVILYFNQSSNRTGIESNINTYYDIYGTGNTGVNTPLLDTYSDAAAAYSLRKLRTSYNGPVNLSKRKDAIQNVSTAQPKIYDSSTGIVIENGGPAVQFDNTDDRFVLSTIQATASNYEIFAVSNSTSTSLSWFFDARSGRLVLDAQSRIIVGDGDAYYDGVNNIGNKFTDNIQSIKTWILDSTGNNSAAVYQNGTLWAGSLPYTQRAIDGIIRLGDSSYDNRGWGGRLQELVFYATNPTGNRIDIENNINSAFQIYAANFSSVLDTVPLAKAAYSIRRLTKNYIGPIITVTNGSTTRDFYADFWGNLDVDALTSFANGGTLSVTKWWDQSGEGVHLLTTSTRPTLTIANNEVSVNTTNKFYEPLLDRYEGAAAAYSLRILKGDYTGPLVRVRRDVTNTEVDVYPDENLTISLNSPVLNVAEATTDVTVNPEDTSATTLGEFVADAGNDPDGLGATVSAFVVVWYDQANSNNASQDISTSQPKIYDSVNGVVTENGKPAITRTSQTMQLDFSIDRSSGVYSVAFVGQVVDRSVVFSDNGSGYVLFAKSNETNSSFGNLSSTSVFVDGSSSSISSAGDAYAAFISNQSLVSVFTSHSWASDSLSLGYSGSATGMYQLQEIIIYTTDQSSNRTGIESNINNHYQIPNFNATASTAQTVAVYNNAINTTVDLNATYTDLKEIIKYE